LMGILGVTIFARTALSAEVKKSTAPTAPVIRAVIGIVDHRKLAAVRADYPELANKVLPQIAADNKLKIVIRKTAVMWIAPATQTLDITDLVLASLKTLAPPRTSTQLTTPTPPRPPANPTVADPNQLTEAQRSSANQALKALRKLEAAIEVGLTRASYSDRLIDTKADVQENLRVLPEGELKKEIGMAMDWYVIALNTWTQLNGQPVDMEDFLRIPWQNASEHIVKAEKILK